MQRVTNHEHMYSGLYSLVLFTIIYQEQTFLQETTKVIKVADYLVGGRDLLTVLICTAKWVKFQEILQFIDLHSRPLSLPSLKSLNGSLSVAVAKSKAPVSSSIGI